MAEPLKNLLHPALVRAVAGHLARIDGFDRRVFEDHILDGFEDLELMQRSDRIADALAVSLPHSVPDILPELASLLHPETDSPIDSAEPDDQGLRGWALVAFGTYVATHGLEHPEESLAFLKEMTKRFTAEFAVRPFFRDHTRLTLAHATEWAADPNVHVRRLASEGSRPRLPWGLQLKTFIADPGPVMPILTMLRDDDEDYVRRSVANNLNDISKDHPALVAKSAAEWMNGAARARQRLVKHACRSLIKAGDPAALAVFGYGVPHGLRAEISVSPSAIALGGALEMTAKLTSPTDLPVLIDLQLRFLKADGKLSPKVFKWTESNLVAGIDMEFTKSIPLRPVTTRKHYAGRQEVALQVNGKVVAEAEFDLTIP